MEIRHEQVAVAGLLARQLKEWTMQVMLRKDLEDFVKAKVAKERYLGEGMTAS
jgi:hypothetical protein